MKIGLELWMLPWMVITQSENFLFMSYANESGCFVWHIDEACLAPLRTYVSCAKLYEAISKANSDYVCQK